MNYEDLDARISQLEQTTPRPSSVISGPIDFEWGALFALAKSIQAEFNSGIRYPSKHLRDAAWIRFNDARSKAFEVANHERSKYRDRSAMLRNEICKMAHKCSWDYFTEGVAVMLTLNWDFFKTTADEMKQKGRALNEAAQYFSSNKHRMLPEHKAECHEQIVECRKTHEVFWERYKAESRERVVDRERKQESYNQKRSEAMVRARANIAKNKNSLERAENAREKVEANLERNREKLASAWTDAFRDRVSEWIEEDEEKLRSIDESIDRLKGWIREDEDRLEDMENRV